VETGGATGVVAAIVLAVAALAGAILLWRRRRGGPVVVPAADVARPAVSGIRAALSATRARLRERLDAAASGGGSLDRVEEALIAADVGARTSATIVGRVRERVGRSSDRAVVRAALGEAIRGVLPAAGVPVPRVRPWVILVTGVNGVGKTTTIGKLAALHRREGRRVLVVAADTFRAAAIDQLGVWAKRTGADIVRHREGADPSAVVFDGMQAALARDLDVVLIDTAGRLHTRSPLMEELGKVRRTIERAVPGAPHEVLLVVDGTTGQNAMSQARAFAAAVGLTAVVVTKLDGTAKGGVLVALGQELDLPVQYVGIGEGIEDLRPFDPDEFVAGLIGD
jgi:fused signal recognition particle receptor